VCFATEADYAAYRILPGADGFSLTGSVGEYIVVHGSRSDLRLAAHEYAHLLIHSSGFSLPDWLAEGVSEVVSSVRFGERYSLIGGDLPGRSQQLKTTPWMTPDELFRSNPKILPDVAREPLFYSQSWAVTETLLVSPTYAPGFAAFLAMLARGSSTAAALQGVYTTTPEALFRDARDRVSHGMTALPLPPVAANAEVTLNTAEPFSVRVMLAGLRHAAGDTSRAETLYRELAAERPADASIRAELGYMALERKDTEGAAREWGIALQQGLRDADLCFRYAQLADALGLGEAQVRAALERAIELRPDFDAAHFRLGTMDRNASRPAEAIAHFRAMKPPSPERAWLYYTSLADALLELNRRAEAKDAAMLARRAAITEEEHTRARNLAYLADTEMSVEIVRGPDGRREFRTVRVPVNAAPRNPFIEADEEALSAEASLDRVECGDDGSRLVVKTKSGPLSLDITDPSRVQIRNAGGVKFEFVCGPQQPRAVLVEFTAARVLRGLELR
jgi:tetratricopeptide (TPR) repeat protein